MVGAESVMEAVDCSVDGSLCSDKRGVGAGRCGWEIIEVAIFIVVDTLGVQSSMGVPPTACVGEWCHIRGQKSGISAAA